MTRSLPAALAAVALATVGAPPTALAQSVATTSASATGAVSYVVATERTARLAVMLDSLAARRAPSAALRAFGVSSARTHTRGLREIEAAAAAAGVAAHDPRLTADQRRQVRRLSTSHGASFTRVFLEQSRELNRESIVLQRGYARVGDDPALRRVAGRLADAADGRTGALQALEP